VVHGDSDHPSRQSGAAIELIQTGQDAEYDILRGIAGIVRIRKHPATDGSDAREDLACDFLEGRAITRGRQPNEAKVVLSG